MCLHTRTNQTLTQKTLTLPLSHRGMDVFSYRLSGSSRLSQPNSVLIILSVEVFFLLRIMLYWDYYYYLLLLLLLSLLSLLLLLLLLLLNHYSPNLLNIAPIFLPTWVGRGRQRQPAGHFHQHPLLLKCQTGHSLRGRSRRNVCCSSRRVWPWRRQKWGDQL